MSQIEIYSELRWQGQWVSLDRWMYDDSFGRKWFYQTHLFDRVWPSKPGFSNNTGLVESLTEAHNYNYYLSALLGDLYNYMGLSQNDMGLKYVAPLKGLPSDVSSDVQRKFEQDYSPDIHPASWLTVAELIQFDWSQTATLSRTISAYQYYEWQLALFDFSKLPIINSYYPSMDPSRDLLVDEQEVARLIHSLAWNKMKYEVHMAVATELKHYYCTVTREVPYYALVPKFWSERMSRLLTLGEPEDVRIIFWFDNL